MTQINMKGSRDTLDCDCSRSQMEKGDSGAHTHTSKNCSRNTSPNAVVDTQPKKGSDKKDISEKQSPAFSPSAVVDTQPMKGSDRKGISEKQSRAPSPSAVVDTQPKKGSDRKGISEKQSRAPSPSAVVDTQPKKGSDKKDISVTQSRAPSRNGRGSTPSPTHVHASRTPTRNGRGTTPSPIQIRSATHSPASPDECAVRKAQGAHIHLKSARPPGCNGESNQTTVNEVHNRIARRRGLDDNAHVSPRDIENIRPWSCNTPDSERPRSSPPCNCGVRKCTHELSRDHGKDFAFMDGFETKEQPWKPGKKVCDQFNDQPRSEYRWKSSRRSIPGADRMQSRAPEWRSDDPPISRKGSGGRDGGSAQVQREYDPYGNPLNNPEWEWHPGKGRGNGPIPGEWLPPFRAYSTRAETEPPPFLRGKGSGRRHSDEWLPPFRVVDRPASWHRSKGAGSGPPPDQWTPPWGHESAADAERGESAASGRSNSCCLESECPESSKFWRSETREVY